jgi:hypothetical protein
MKYRARKFVFMLMLEKIRCVLVKAEALALPCTTTCVSHVFVLSPNGGGDRHQRAIWTRRSTTPFRDISVIRSAEDTEDADPSDVPDR